MIDNKKKVAALVGGASALAMALATPAFASHTKLTVGGSSASGSVPVTASLATSTVGFMSDIGTQVLCTTSSISGSLDRGATIAVGQKVGSISSLTLSNCDLDGFPVSITMNAGDITVAGHPTNPGDPVPVSIAVPTATITGTGCNLTATGSVAAVVSRGTNGTAAPDGAINLTPVDFGTMGGFDLTITVPGAATTSCGGQANDGDTAGPTDLSSSGFTLSTGGLGDISHG